MYGEKEEKRSGDNDNVLSSKGVEGVW